MTDLQSKKEFLDTFQKKLTHACMQQCFEQTHVKKDCIDKCFFKYVAATQATVDTMLEVGRPLGSEYPRRLKREFSLFTDLIYSEAQIKYKYANPAEAQARDRSSKLSR